MVFSRKLDYFRAKCSVHYLKKKFTIHFYTVADGLEEVMIICKGIKVYVQ